MQLRRKGRGEENGQIKSGETSVKLEPKKTLE